MGARRDTRWPCFAAALVLAAGCGRFGFDEGDDAGDDTVDVTARVTVRLDGAGMGTVIGLDQDCTTTECFVDVDLGTSFSLRGIATSDGWFRGWSGPCGGRSDCDFVADADVTIAATFTPRPNYAFLSSTTTTGAIGSVAAADTICADAATDAGFEGVFVAYLSSTTSNAAERLAGSRGWIRVDGAPVADLPNDFRTGPLIYPIRLDEDGVDLGAVEVYTATRGGDFYGESCLDWTTIDPTVSGHSASAAWTSILATESFAADCDEAKHLLCVETGRSVPVVAVPHTSGRVGFVTRAGWTPGGGIASADAACAAEATSIGRTGTFVAMLATSTTTAAGRMTVPGAPWMRLDGVRYSDDVANTFSGTHVDVPFELDSDGQRVDDIVWIGAQGTSIVASSPSDNCSDWTSTDAAVDGIYGYTATTYLGNQGKQLACDNAARLFCVEQ
jgi:hypothetical protein